MANFYDNDRDVLTGGTYVNYYGGDGNDILYGNDQPNGVYGGHGSDVLTGSYRTGTTGAGTPADPHTYSGFEPSGNDTLEGGAGGDALHGADGDDKLYGGDGDDSGLISTYAGYVLIGGLYGGLGRDVMWGGEGADWFIFQTASESGQSKASADVIRDFSREEGDRVHLSGLGVDFDFIGKKKFKGDGDAELSFKKGWLSGDANGDGAVDFMIKMVGITKMKDGDFII
jgi:Ca2+-binding RTX toxin-like protein